MLSIPKRAKKKVVGVNRFALPGPCAKPRKAVSNVPRLLPVITAEMRQGLHSFESHGSTATVCSPPTPAAK